MKKKNEFKNQYNELLEVIYNFFLPTLVWTCFVSFFLYLFNSHIFYKYILQSRKNNTACARIKLKNKSFNYFTILLSQFYGFVQLKFKITIFKNKYQNNFLSTISIQFIKINWFIVIL